MDKDWLEKNQKTVQEEAEGYLRETKPIDLYVVERELGLEGGLIMPVTATIQRESDGQDIFYTAEYNNLHLRYGFGEFPYESWSHTGAVTVYLSLAGKVSLRKREGEKRLWNVQTGDTHCLDKVRHSTHGVPLGLYNLDWTAKLWGLDESNGRKRRIDPGDSQFRDLLKEAFCPLNEKLRPTYSKIIRKEYDILRSL